MRRVYGTGKCKVVCDAVSLDFLKGAKVGGRRLCLGWRAWGLRPARNALACQLRSRQAALGVGSVSLTRTRPVLPAAARRSSSRTA